VLGTKITSQESANILERLGCVVERHADRLEVGTPSFRPDLEREIDLVEEVLRIWGMERISPTLPRGSGRAGGMSPDQRTRERVGAILRAAGLNETMTYAFADPTDLESFT
jgi:phenylalanyl-tRNA synthetase beta chain